MVKYIILNTKWIISIKNILLILIKLKNIKYKKKFFLIHILLGKNLIDDVKSETSGDFKKLVSALCMTTEEYDVKCIHDVNI